MSSSPRTLIVGAGIAGLSLALALARKGCSSFLMDRAPVLEEVGAGIQLSPNASRLLRAWGLEEALTPYISTPESLIIHSGVSGAAVVTLPLGHHITQWAGAPYWTIHRADLQRVLLQDVQRTGLATLQTSASLETIEQSETSASLSYTVDGHLCRQQGDVVVGADGVWSAVREHLMPDVQPAFQGRIAWRTVMDAAHLPSSLSARNIYLWLAPHMHLVCYPVRQGRDINVVAITSGSWHEPGWNVPASLPDVLSEYYLWPDVARELLGGSPHYLKWALVDLPALPFWTRGRVTLMGDAAHPMLPFMAQGAAMAIEDADILSDVIASGKNLESYESGRLARTRRVQDLARKNDKIYHAAAAVAFVRDKVMRLMGGSRLLHGLGWLYRGPHHPL